MTTIHRIAAFSDNYIWALVNDRAKTCALVDPGDAQPAIDFITAHDLNLTHLLITHHHRDHTGGISTLKARYGCHVIGPNNPNISGIDEVVGESDTIKLSALECEFRVMEVPGHTLDHIAFYQDGRLFCGDTLFAGGCGRLFEGTAKQMWRSLQKLAALPDETAIYCAHEYTAANLDFALAVEPNNPELKQRVAKVTAARQQQQATVPSHLAQERATNPFLRADQDSVKLAAETFCQQPLSTHEEVFGCIRQWKDNF